MFPDASGTRLVIIDDKSDAFVYNPVNECFNQYSEFMFH